MSHLKIALLNFIRQICKWDIDDAWSGGNKEMFNETADWQW
jgi:hypothetical protein